MSDITRNKHNFLIQITGLDSLSFDHIATLMNTKKEAIKIDTDIAHRLAVEDGDMVARYALTTGRKVDVEVSLSDSVYSAV